MSEGKKDIQVTLYVSKKAKPRLIESGCKKGDCHRPMVNENLARATINLREGFYTTRTQEIINDTKKYCEKHKLPLEIENISGKVKRIRLLLTKKILKLPALEITSQQEKLKFKASYPLDSIKFTEFLNRITLTQA